MLLAAVVRSTPALGGTTHAAPDSSLSEVTAPPRSAFSLSRKDRPLVRTRIGSERGKLAVDESGGGAAHPATKKPSAAEQAVNMASNDVEKCVNCQYYDRRHARPTDGKAPMWGQCRRHSPALNPVTAKAYVVEGVWPLVRDDDWCGEWKALTRTIEPITEVAAPVAAEGIRAPARPALVSAAAESSSPPAND